MDKLIAALLANPSVQKLMLAMAAKIGEQLTALLPVIVAAVTKAIGDQLKSVIPGGLHVPDATVIAEQVREQVNQIPDIDIPVLSDLFDLTEWLKHKG